MERWWGALVLAAAGVFAISGALRYRSGRHPELGRHRDTAGLWTWQRNIIFAAEPMGVLLIGAALLAAMGNDAPVVASAVVTVVTVAALVSCIVFAYRPADVAAAREERLPGRRQRDDPSPPRRTVTSSPRRHRPPAGPRHQPVRRWWRALRPAILAGRRSPLIAQDYLFLGGSFAVATLVWWVLSAISRR